VGDLNRDGISDLAVGAVQDDDGGLDRGAVWILFLNGDGTVRSHQKISATEGGFGGTLAEDDLFGASVAPVGDHDGDGFTDLAVGAHGDDDGGLSRGAAWVLFLEGAATCPWDCAGDIDGVVGATDIATLLQQWDGAGSCDLDADGTVGITDFLALLAHWGPCP
jgi:hypothetical protein